MWIDDFLSFLSPPQIDKIDIHRALLIKNANLPSMIFKFRGANKYSLNNFAEDTVWVCSAESYNDPYECSSTISMRHLARLTTARNFDAIISRTNLHKHLTVEELDKAKTAEDPMRHIAYILLRKDQTVPQDHHEHFIDALFQAAEKVSNDFIWQLNAISQRGMKVCSFSARNDSIVMWGHYADSHKGFCLEYDFEALPAGEIRRRMLYPVIYSQNLFDATRYLEESLTKGNFNNLYGVLAAIHKAPEWSYEQEWRLVLPLGDSFPNQNFSMPTPSALYLGTRISDKDEAALTEIAQSKAIPVYKMRLSPMEFKLEPQAYVRSPRA